MTGTTPLPEPGRGAGTARGGTNPSARCRLAPEPAPSSSLHVVDLVDRALRGLDEELAAHGVRDPDGSLRATVRSALVVASGVPEYDVAIAAARGRVALRVKHSELGLVVHVVELGARTGAYDAGSRPVDATGEP